MTRYVLLLVMSYFASVPVLRATEPVWRFTAEENDRSIGKSVGSLSWGIPGPRAPEFAGLSDQNQAVRFAGRGARIEIADPGEQSPFDFGAGETFSVELWVHLQEIDRNENIYLIGKGRTHQKGQPENNQNWGLRLREMDDQARPSFVFFSTGTKDQPGEWHRWTAKQGFIAHPERIQWHHVGFSYTFGQPDSLVCWLDGQPIAGTWDMGGATDLAPVVDNDAVWIGSSQGGQAASSLRGMLDDISLSRVPLDAEQMRQRFQRTGDPYDLVLKEPLLPISEPPAGRIAVQVHDGVSSHAHWPFGPASVPAPVSQYETTAFVFPRLPHRYESWGIRDEWHPPALLRAVTRRTLPEGKHRWLLRSRGGSRLWIDGQLVGQTAFHRNGAGGHEPVPPVPEPPTADTRPVGYGDHEFLVDFETTGGEHVLVFETLVGRASFRPEPGECCVAVQWAGHTGFEVLATDSGAQIPLTEAGWKAIAARQEQELVVHDDRTRRALAASQDKYWNERHQHAAAWVAAQPAISIPTIPDLAGKWPVSNPIDQFLAAKAAQFEARPLDPADEQFRSEVWPLLQQHCIRCHGDKAKGGLRLNTAEASRGSGDSGLAAIVPGKPEDSELLARITSDDDSRMPPSGEGLKPAEVETLRRWIQTGAHWANDKPVNATPTPLVSDAAFLRRVSLDTVGVPATSDEVRDFLADSSPRKRTDMVERLLDDPRGADHWISYWQDVLAENPNILKPSLNNSGPFRFFLYESLRDDKPWDRLVTELIQMRGSTYYGGSAGFSMAADNDAPLASKAHIIGTAFLGVEMQCARCHDAPFHSSKQADLFGLAAMLDRKPLSIPKSSSVPPGFFEQTSGRVSRIKVSIQPGEPIAPRWPFEAFLQGEPPQEFQTPDDTRAQLALLVTCAENERFSQVLVNRIWKRLMGAGFVEPASDWEGHPASHPELLRWLAREFVASGYSAKHVVRLILNSHAYQREAVTSQLAAGPEHRLFPGPERRRLTAEQIVDSLFAASGKEMSVEPITFDSDGRNAVTAHNHFGNPRRAWEFTSLSNERDRPSLALPRAQAVIDVLEAFGWRAARQNPTTDRETSPNVLQPGILSNGTLATWVSRLSEDHPLTEIAYRAESPVELADELSLRFLNRLPTPEERQSLIETLAPGFEQRLVPGPWPELTPLPRLSRVSWANHLREEANAIMLENERRARAGEPPTQRLQAEWRERFEDAIWSMFNLPEFVWSP